MEHDLRLVNSLNTHVWIPATADGHLPLPSTTVDLWRISLNQPPQLDILSKDEVVRMHRYRFAADQRKFAVARSSLRTILGGYSQQDPANLVFDYGPHGKPYVRTTPALEFNLSHSGDYALCGIARQAIGVDIEQLRSMDRLEGLIKRCLAPSEQQTIASVLPAQKSQAFLEYWTCKEAYLKATGQGISDSLSEIAVELEPAPLLKVPGEQWQLTVFVPCDGYTAAMVVPPRITQIRFWKYSP